MALVESDDYKFTFLFVNFIFKLLLGLKTWLNHYTTMLKIKKAKNLDVIFDTLSLLFSAIHWLFRSISIYS